MDSFDIQAIESAPTVRMRVCPACHGHGIIHISDYFYESREARCYKCEGTGVIPVEGEE